MAETKRADKASSIWTPTFIILLVINFFFSMSQMMNNNIIPLYARDIGLTASIIGFVMSVFYIAALCVRPFSGPAYDSFSKKRLLQIAYAVTVFANFMYVFAANQYILITARIIHGMALGCIAPLTMAFVSDILPTERMASGLSIYTTAQVLAQVIGPAFGIEMTRFVGYQLTFIISASSMTLAGLLTFFLKEPPLTEARPPYRIGISRIIVARGVPTAICLMLMAIGFACIVSFIAIYAEAMGMMDIGVYFMVYAVVMMATRPIAGRLADQFGINKVLMPSIICFAVALFVLSFARTLPMFIVVAVIAAFGYGTALPLLQSMPFKFVPRSKSGAASNTNYIALDIGLLCGPLLGGHIVDALLPITGSEWAAYAGMFRLAVIPTLLALVLFLLLRKRLARYEAEAATARGE